MKTTVHRKPTHVGRHLHFESDHLPHVKKGVITNWAHRAKKQGNQTELSLVNKNLSANANPEKQVESMINTKKHQNRQRERRRAKYV